MKVFREAESMRAFSRAKRAEGMRIAFVPTMGYLHAGHLSLVEAAREQGDIVVVSIYVNPTQFSRNEDFGVYPKDAASDHAKLKSLGVHAIFQPATLYAAGPSHHNDLNEVAGASPPRPGNHETFVQVELLQQPLCGQSRPHFFRGVATEHIDIPEIAQVVSKLFNIVEPDVAVFGQKDYQQLQIIKRLVRDLDFAIKIIGQPIAREADGLAMSSRNALLDPSARQRAPGIFQALQVSFLAMMWARMAQMHDKTVSPSTLRQGILERLRVAGCIVDYAEVVDAETLQPVQNVHDQPTLVAVAAVFGDVRLIDNVLLNMTFGMPASGKQSSYRLTAPKPDNPTCARNTKGHLTDVYNQLEKKSYYATDCSRRSDGIIFPLPFPYMVGCCGLYMRSKTKSSLSTSLKSDRPDSQEGSLRRSDNPDHGDSLQTRASLTRIRSSGSIYYDAAEEPDPGVSPVPSTGDSGGARSPPTGFSDGPADEPRGTLSSLVDIFTRRTSLKHHASNEEAASPSGRLEISTIVEEDGSLHNGQPRCLPTLRSGGGASASHQLQSSASGLPAVKQFVPLMRPEAGRSFKRGEQKGTTEGVECWQETDATTFHVRSKSYIQNKKKEPSRGAIYNFMLEPFTLLVARLIGVDAYSFEQKIHHIAQHVELPPAPKLGPDASALPPSQQIPPLLVINIQLPLYSASFFGPMDGKNCSLVYYFALPEGWETSHVGNDAAVALLQRFVHDIKDADKSSTRDRLKLIARVVNVEEWAKKGPLGSAEHKLLVNYNNKPILTRPQQSFYSGPNYLEIDLDIHSYVYLARKAFSAFILRLGPVVFENAFVVQGNRPEELPEVVMACARVSRIDLYKVEPFPGRLRRTESHRTTVEIDPNSPPLTAHTFPDDTVEASPPA